jgi:hypothetical protein
MDIEEYIGHRIDNEPVNHDSLVTPQPPIKRKPKKPHGSSRRHGQKQGKGKSHGQDKHRRKHGHKQHKDQYKGKARRPSSDTA